MSVHRRRREPNLYGYLFSSASKKAPWPGTQLQTLLKLQNNEPVFRILKKNIVDLMDKHMDLNLTGCSQEDNLRAVEIGLKEQIPEIFASEESEKRLYFAIRLVLHEHSNRRYRSRTRNHHHLTTPSRNSPISTRNQRKNGPRAESEPDRGGDNHEMPESASQILPRSNKSSTDIQSDTTHKKNDPNQYRDIHSFLEASTPPMTHLMDAFIDFGCVNADFLLAISSWSLERIRGVLDQLSLGPNNGRKLTEMEKFILQNHFKEYSTQLGKKGNSSMRRSEL